MSQSNRNIKDSVFTDLFSNGVEGKKNFLSLYNAIHGTDLKYEETVIENKTIPQTVYKTLRNDVSMLINNKLIVMIEHQSTINENMPFRLLEYVTRIYEGIVPAKAKYLKKRIPIPTPEFYVFYNGTEKYPDEKTLRLSDSFYPFYNAGDFFPQLELTVSVINIGPGQTLKFQDGCDILKQYCEFIEIVREHAVRDNPESYELAIKEAIRRGILSEYLRRNSTEVINMFIVDYDYDTDMAVQREEAREEGLAEGRAEGHAEGLAEGRAKGRNEKSVEAAVLMVREFNITPETASEKIGAPLDKVLEALKQ